MVESRYLKNNQNSFTIVEENFERGYWHPDWYKRKKCIWGISEDPYITIISDEEEDNNKIRGWLSDDEDSSVSQISFSSPQQQNKKSPRKKVSFDVKPKLSDTYVPTKDEVDLMNGCVCLSTIVYMVFNHLSRIMISMRFAVKPMRISDIDKICNYFKFFQFDSLQDLC